MAYELCRHLPNTYTDMLVIIIGCRRQTECYIDVIVLQQCSAAQQNIENARRAGEIRQKRCSLIKNNELRELYILLRDCQL